MKLCKNQTKFFKEIEERSKIRAIMQFNVVVVLLLPLEIPRGVLLSAI